MLGAGGSLSGVIGADGCRDNCVVVLPLVAGGAVVGGVGVVGESVAVGEGELDADRRYGRLGREGGAV